MSAMPPLGAFSEALFVATALLAGVLTWFRPAYGLALVVLLDPFDFSHAAGPTTLGLPKAALAGFLLSLAVRRAPLRPLWGRAARPIAFGAVAILAATALAATQADYLSPAVREIVKALEYLAAFAGAVVAFSADPDERVVGIALALSAGVVALVALSQEVTGSSSALVLQGRVITRIAGPLEGPNQLAGYFDIVLPVLLALLVRSRLRWLAPVLGLCAIADVLTLSRAGILAAFIGCAIVVALGGEARRAKRYAAALGIVLLIVFLGLGAAGLLARFARFDSEGQMGGLGTRSELWRAALAMWRSHPWLGVGGGNYELELPRAGVTDAQTHANSLYLQSLAEGGLALFAAVTGTLAAALVVLRRAVSQSSLVLGAFAATAALALHQIFDLLVFFPKVGLLWWLVLGVGAAAANLRPGRAAQQVAPREASNLTA
jgi:O-antigen ligase